MKKALQKLLSDPDIESESRDLANLDLSRDSIPQTSSTNQSQLNPEPYRYIPLQIQGNSFRGNKHTAELLREIGGGDEIRKMTDVFYKKAFADPHLDQFIMNHNDPHFERLGNWIVEKMGGEGNVWTAERAVRNSNPTPITLATGHNHIVHDRTSAHVAAWHSTKRPKEQVGQHFNLADARVWMRLMFWSAREVGLFTRSPTFEDWYIRFIAHFVRVYEREAPLFARESARWSLEPNNIREYLEAGCRMDESVLGGDGIGVPSRVARAQLPRAELADTEWPYSTKRL